MNSKSDHAETIASLRAASPQLRARVLNELAEIDWFRDLDADTRSWVGMVIDAGMIRLQKWLANPLTSNEPGSSFGAVPFDAARAVSLEQTVTMVRTALHVGEDAVDELAAPGDAQWLRAEMGRFGRELAFGAAAVYARAAEERGSWDARLETHLIDLLLADHSENQISQTAMALGWPTTSRMIIWAETIDAADELAIEIRLAARNQRTKLIAVVHGSVLIVMRLLADDSETEAPPEVLQRDGGAIVQGIAEDLMRAAPVLRAVLQAVECLPARPASAGIVDCDELLVERALSGATDAGDELVNRYAHPLTAAGPDSVATADAMIASGGSLAATARTMPMHISTLRYRLDRIAELTGNDLRDSETLYATRIALVLMRLRRFGQEPSTLPTVSYEP